MINIKQTVGSGLSDITVDEQTFATYTQFTNEELISFIYDNGDWNYENSVVDLTDYGISFTGTPVNNDVLTVSYIPGLIQFYAGDGISAPDLNTNFELLRTQSNANEASITNLENTCLRIDGTNISDATVAAFNRSLVATLPGTGTSSLLDNTEHFLEPTGNCSLEVPSITPGDLYSHTINVVVQGSNYTVTLLENGVVITRHLLNYENIDTTLPYNIFLVYNHSDGHWYYYISQ